MGENKALSGDPWQNFSDWYKKNREALQRSRIEVLKQIGRDMNEVTSKNKLSEQLAVLRDVAKDYPGKTIENIIQQMEAREKVLVSEEE